MCLRVLPIAALIRNSDWAKFMRIASQEFIDDELQRAPISRPFYLKAGARFVTADAAGKLGTTGEKEKATPVYIETLPRRRRFPWQGEIDLLTTPGALFLLAFEIDDQRFYLCILSRGIDASRRDVRLSVLPMSSLYKSAKGTRRLASHRANDSMEKRRLQ